LGSLEIEFIDGVKIMVGNRKFVLYSVVLVYLGILASAAVVAQPLRLHPQNPRWFEWRGKATALITSAEHYGAVLNLDFDFEEYLETLRRDGMNYTRIFAGTYVEPPGAFGIKQNTLAPAPGRFMAPWSRSDQSGYAGGGNKFDLETINPDYLERLRDFVRQADACGVVVELTFFCSTYAEPQWSLHPLNPVNNIQAYEVADWKKINTMETNPDILEIQKALVVRLTKELNDFDNLFFEIQNEPWADNHEIGELINPYVFDYKKWANSVEITLPTAVKWQREIAQVIVDTESELTKQHLIAQNIANFKFSVHAEDLVPQASILNFHYAYPELVGLNRGWQRVIGYDETGFAGEKDQTYRRQAWNFVMSGGALFNNLDYSFAVGNERGNAVNKAPGGGSEALRKQLKTLSQFLHQFELEKLNPDSSVVLHAPGVTTRALSCPGHQYAIYVEGRRPDEVVLNLTPANYSFEWLDVVSGEIVKRGEQPMDDSTELACPDSGTDFALCIQRVAD
jgi:hypothetical protein